MNVALVGASPKPDRYAYKAWKRLVNHGHTVYLVHPKYPDIEGERVYANVSDIPTPIDTITLYVNAERSTEMADAILALSPRRLIFNPGAENPELEKRAIAKGIQAVGACTLVLLGTNQF